MIYYFTLSLNPSPPFIRLRKSMGCYEKMNIKLEKPSGKRKFKRKRQKAEHENPILDEKHVERIYIFILFRIPTILFSLFIHNFINRLG